MFWIVLFLAQAAVPSQIERGEALFFDAQQGCGSCHALKGKGTAVVNVALFGHAHILRILAARWIGLEARGGELFALDTGSVSVLGWERETRVIARWNRGFEE